MRHFANPKFWDAYQRLPERVRGLADKNYVILKENPRVVHKIGGRWRIVATQNTDVRHGRRH